jgi:hypothetical protein
MRYRVLVPWLLGGKTSRVAVVAYTLIKAILLGAVLWTSQRVLGNWVWLALIIMATWQFDYWEQYAELFGILGMLSGEPWLIIVSAVVWGLSKETAWALIPMALVTGYWGALSGVAVLILVRLVQGKAPLYCERWTFWTRNWTDLKAMQERGDPYPLVAIVWSLAALASLLWGDQMSVVLQRTAWMVPVYLVTAWTMARPREIRILLPTAIWMIGAWG